jgi:hypothetical protein
MSKKTTQFKSVRFDWMIPVAERQRIEAVLSEMGYTVDGGGTNLADATADIFIRPKPRVRNRTRKAAEGGAQ